MSPSTPEDDRTVASPTPSPPGRHDSGNALRVGTFLDEFELQSVAGEGGFSIVYRAWDHSLNRRVAVKEYFPSGMVGRADGAQVVVRSQRHTEAFEAGLRSFVEEARLLAQFDHPALIKVYRFWKANGSAYMVMPFCEGITLREAWRLHPEPPDEAALLALLDPLTDALAVLHAEHWYHRDIAPDNVMLLAGAQRPLLLDFGAARQVIGDMTHALTVILKPGYAPIEQWGEMPGMQQGPWTDIYALAAMIHFAITGSTPPPSVGRLLDDSFTPLAQAAAGRYSPRFLRALDHALMVRPEQRTASIDVFRQEIGLPEIVRTAPTMTWMPTAAAPARKPAPDPLHAAPTLQPDLELPSITLPTPHEDRGGPEIEFTRQPESAPGAAMAGEQRAAMALPQSAAGRPALLFALGLLVTGALGLIGYRWLQPAPTAAPAVTSAATSAQAPTAMPPAADAPAAAPPTEATPAAAVAVPPASPAPASDAGADDFQRIVAAQTPEHQVAVTLVRTTLRSEKDGLEFTVDARRDGYLYAFNRGSDGALLQLYPNRISGLLRVRAGKPLDLPDRKVEFKIAGASGPNQLLVMVSTLPRDHSALPARDEGGFAFYPTGEAARALSARHSGPLPWIAGVPKCPASGPCDDSFGAVVAVFNVVQ